MAEKTDPKVRIGRAVEQSVLQSPEVRAWKRDADRYRHLRDEAAIRALLPSTPAQLAAKQ